MINKVKCKHYDDENGWCKKLSDWSDPMPYIEYCPKSPCEYAEPIEQPTNNNDIIKALECCMLNKKCEECPLCRTLREPCRVVLAREALNLINRQKSEIERLTGYNENLRVANSDITNKLWDEVEEAKTEAIKEFAEKTDKIIAEIYKKFIFGYDLEDEAKEAVMDFSNDISCDIDNLVKEMTEGEDDTD